MPAFRPLLPALALALCAAVPLAVHAADTPAPPRPAAAPADKLAPARALIAQGRWRDAIQALQKVDDKGSADWNNLMGYTHRKAAPPDLAAAEGYYDAALRIDPRHRGALEYSGELFLMTGHLPRAEERLAALEAACPGGCEELKDLRASVAAHKAGGGKGATKP